MLFCRCATFWTNIADLEIVRKNVTAELRRERFGHIRKAHVGQPSTALTDQMIMALNAIIAIRRIGEGQLAQQAIARELFQIVVPVA